MIKLTQTFLTFQLAFTHFNALFHVEIVYFVHTLYMYGVLF